MSNDTALLADFAAIASASGMKLSLTQSAAGTPHATVQCEARIVGGFETASGERASFGVRLDLPPMEAGA